MNFKKIKTIINEKLDPFINCQKFSIDGCFCVDLDECEELDDKIIEHPLSVLLSNVPEELYFNSTWVKDICEVANSTLIELDTLKKSVCSVKSLKR